jgi:hypothetical protein
MTLSFVKDTELPAVIAPNTLYFIKTADGVTLHLSDVVGDTTVGAAADAKLIDMTAGVDLLMDVVSDLSNSNVAMSNRLKDIEYRLDMLMLSLF